MTSEAKDDENLDSVSTRLAGIRGKLGEHKKSDNWPVIVDNIMLHIKDAREKYNYKNGEKEMTFKCSFSNLIEIGSRVMPLSDI